MKGRHSEVWPHTGRAALALGALALIYALYLWFFASPGDLYGWLSTLFSTLISVFLALVVGLALFEHQTRETNRADKEELSHLLRTEFGEIGQTMRESRSTIRGSVFTRTYRPLQFEAHVERHYPNPLIVEEAVKSRLFGTHITAELLALARLMRAHRLAVEEAIGLSFAVAGREASDVLPDEDVRERIRYGMAVQSVIDSEERLVEACAKALVLLSSEK